VGLLASLAAQASHVAHGGEAHRALNPGSAP